MKKLILFIVLCLFLLPNKAQSQWQLIIKNNTPCSFQADGYFLAAYTSCGTTPYAFSGVGIAGYSLVTLNSSAYVTNTPYYGYPAEVRILPVSLVNPIVAGTPCFKNLIDVGPCSPNISCMIYNNPGYPSSCVGSTITATVSYPYGAGNTMMIVLN